MSMNFSSFTANKSNPRATTRRSRLHKQAQQGGIMVNEELLNIYVDHIKYCMSSSSLKKSMQMKVSTIIIIKGGLRKSNSNEET